MSVLILKRLRGSVSHSLPSFFKNIFFRERMRPYFFCNFNFNIVTSHIFPEYVIIKIPQVVQKIWRFSPSILALFIYFSDFLTFPYYKETNGVTYNRWCQQFFNFNLLLISCLTLLTFMFVPDIITWVKNAHAVKKRYSAVRQCE